MKYSILTFILAFLLSGCSVTEDYKDHCPGQGEDEAGFVTLSFKLISSSIATSRADNDNSHREEDSEWPAFEDMIQADDFAFFIFCKQEDGKWPLVLKMTDIKNSTDPNMMITGAPGTYTVTAVISKEELDKLGLDITPGSPAPVDFRIVVLANTGADNDYNKLDTTSFEKFIEDASKWTININTIYQTSSSSEGIDEPFKGGIPMFGLKEFNFTKDALYSSRPEERLWVGEISMLRALSKIRVVDNITPRDADTGLPRIEKVTFQGSTPEAYVLPYNAANYSNGWQVEEPNPVKKDGDTEATRLGYLAAGTIFGYIPEQYIYESPSLPKLNITITFELDETGKPSTMETFEVPMWGYNNERFENFGEAILRNHIYSLSVDLATPHNLECTVTVFPYTVVTLNPLFGFSVPVKSVHIKTAESSADVSEVTVAEGQTVFLVGYVDPEDANNKDIIWKSDAPSIATVTDDGVVKGVSEGETTIRATSVYDDTKSATCKVKVSPKISVKSISLEQTTWTGNIGETVNLVASILPADATNQNIEWTSSDSGIASVSPYGTVTAKSEGTAYITATSVDDRTKSARCTVTVNPKIGVTSVNISATTMTLIEGAQSSLIATVTPTNATNQIIKWTSSANSVATVSSYGLVTAVAAGTATIKAEATDGSGRSATCRVTVTAKRAVTGVTISQSSHTLTITAANPKPTFTLSATVSPNDATYKNVRWTSSNPYVATVGSVSGRYTVTGVSKGTAEITVTSVDDPTKKATCTVTVNDTRPNAN